MLPFRFPEWPFAEGEEVTIHWIASPQIIGGCKVCDVYLRTHTGQIKSQSVDWGALPALRIGDRYINNSFRSHSSVGEFSIPTKKVNDTRIDRAVDLIPKPLYELQNRKIFDEPCCIFTYEECTYYVPCVELARTLLASTSVLANQLLSTGGLENLIDISSWSLHNHTAIVDFRKETPSVSKGLAATFAAIYGTPQLRDYWDKTYDNYLSTGKIMVNLPPEATIRVSFIESNDHKHRLIQQSVLTHVETPVREVIYTPAQTEHSDRSLEKKRTIIEHLPSDNSELDVSGTLARRTQLTTTGTIAEGSFLNNIKAVRLKKKGGQASNVKSIEQESTTESFSVGDVSPVGKRLFASMETQPVNIDSHPDFTAFCNAIELLRKYPLITITEVTFADLPLGKPFSHMDLSPRCRRKYACVSLRKGADEWLIIELCSKDGYSISTLFTKCTNNKEELVNRIIDKLMISNGSWSQDYFPQRKYKTLVHYKYRSKERWAELMYNKMI